MPGKVESKELLARRGEVRELYTPSLRGKVATVASGLPEGIPVEDLIIHLHDQEIGQRVTVLSEWIRLGTQLSWEEQEALTFALTTTKKVLQRRFDYQAAQQIYMPKGTPLIIDFDTNITLASRYPQVMDLRGLNSVTPLSPEAMDLKIPEVAFVASIFDPVNSSMPEKA